MAGSDFLRKVGERNRERLNTIQAVQPETSKFLGKGVAADKADELVRFGKNHIDAKDLDFTDDAVVDRFYSAFFDVLAQYVEKKSQEWSTPTKPFGHGDVINYLLNNPGKTSEVFDTILNKARSRANKNANA